MKYFGPLLLITILVILGCKTRTPEGVKVVNVEELNKLILQEDMQLIDVRTPAETEVGMIANAQNIKYDAQFEDKLSGLDKTKPIVVYCKSGGRSAKASKILLEKGFTEIYDLKGGYDNYIKKEAL